MKFRVPTLVLAVAALTAGCRDTQTMAPRQTPADPSKLIVDGAHHGGNPDFFFLPLLGPDARNSPNFDPGKFNATLSPVVKICKLVSPTTGATTRLLADVATAVCGPLVATLSNVAVFPTLEFYLATWPTRNYNLDPDAFYRVQVFVGSKMLGFVDVTVVTSLREAKNVITGEVVPFADDLTLPIPFRIEAGALTGGASSACKGPTPDCVEVSVKPAGGTFFTNTKWAGIQLESGWASADAFALGGGSIQLTIERVKSRDGNCHGGSEGGDAPALGSLYRELDGCYHYTTDPDLDDPRIPAEKRGFQTDNNKVGQCTHELPTDEGLADADYLLFKSDPGTPIIPLKDVPAPVGLNCTSFAFYQSLPNNPVLRFASIKLHAVKEAISRFVVNEAYAWDGGLGGTLPKAPAPALSFISRGVGLRGARTSTNNQSAPVGTSINFTVRVTTEHLHAGQESRAPKAGVPVTFTAPAGSGNFGEGGTVYTTTTDANGQATVPWFLVAGTHTISATAPTIDPTPITFTATGIAGVLLRATFTADQANAPPGPPEVGTLDFANIVDGTALVQSDIGGIAGNSLEVSTPGSIPGAPHNAARVAGTPPSSGVYLVRWRSSATSGLPTMNFVVRSSTGLILGGVNYAGGTHTFNAGSGADVNFGTYTANVPQRFEMTIDLNAKTVSLSVDGVPISSVQNQPYFQGAAEDLASLSIEFGGLQAYSMAWDDIEIVAWQPSPVN